VLTHLCVIRAKRIHIGAIRSLEATGQLFFFTLILFFHFLKFLVEALNFFLEINLFLCMKFTFLLSSFFTLLFQIALNSMLFSKALSLSIAEFFDLALQLQSVLLGLLLILLEGLLLILVSLF